MTAIQISALQGDLAREILNINDSNVLMRLKEYIISLRTHVKDTHVAPLYTMEELDERLDMAEEEVETYSAQEVFAGIEQKYGWV